jgi:hypothetical protein
MLSPRTQKMRQTVVAAYQLTGCASAATLAKARSGRQRHSVSFDLPPTRPTLSIVTGPIHSHIYLFMYWLFLASRSLYY